MICSYDNSFDAKELFEDTLYNISHSGQDFWDAYSVVANDLWTQVQEHLDEKIREIQFIYDPEALYDNEDEDSDYNNYYVNDYDYESGYDANATISEQLDNTDFWQEVENFI
jgi:hypothetical protein